MDLRCFTWHSCVSIRCFSVPVLLHAFVCFYLSDFLFVFFFIVSLFLCLSLLISYAVTSISYSLTWIFCVFIPCLLGIPVSLYDVLVFLSLYVLLYGSSMFYVAIVLFYTMF